MRTKEHGMLFFSTFVLSREMLVFQEQAQLSSRLRLKGLMNLVGTNVKALTTTRRIRGLTKYMKSYMI
ncbi:hypothetical protein [Siminovitchia sp. FSL W7-1587]|uniref:hypothetical protein n=1 Tax=Siminovitchia sp. FSL W7-1587 TaxID=2954699 RepID=UPI0030CB1139